ncbi:hypothetical protein B0H13DRAFT_1985805 [Mycena leptocephala]|nr:hypothetical protein B0H13DRAFT_1985805 [Mycena leptocephala]
MLVGPLSFEDLHNLPKAHPTVLKSTTLMNHPYSGSASYIYANEYPYTPVDAQHNDPYRKMQSFVPIQSVDSLPISHPYSPQNTLTWTTDGTFTTQSQFSEDDEYVRVRTDSHRPLLPVPARAPPVVHPYSQPLVSWLDAESVVEADTSTVSKFPTGSTSAPSYPPKRNVTIREAAPVRRSPFVPYEPRPFERRETEQEHDRDRSRSSKAWRRKIQRRVKRALRRLRRYLEGLRLPSN